MAGRGEADEPHHQARGGRLREGAESLDAAAQQAARQGMDRTGGRGGEASARARSDIDLNTTIAYLET